MKARSSAGVDRAEVAIDVLELGHVGPARPSSATILRSIYVYDKHKAGAGSGIESDDDPR